MEHAALADVCSWVKGQPGAGKQHVQGLVETLQENSDVRQLADIFVRLQEDRHRADYDHTGAFDKAQTLNLVDQAERGLDLLDQLAGTPDLERFLALLAFHTRLR